jgi:ABC-type molybdate transport system substrate-binding protein
MFTRNRLCALAGPRFSATPDTLFDRMLDPEVKLGTSTPKADPSGDYAWQLFEKAEKLKAGAFATLSDKAMKLTGGPDSPPPPKGRNQYGAIVSAGVVDVFLTYCTNALAAQKEASELRIVQIPETLAVGADYGMTVMKGAGGPAQRLAKFILSEPGQTILSKYGFAAVR